MKHHWHRLRGYVEPVLRQFLRLYEGHKVLTLSVLNAVSLFLFALIAVLASVSDSGTAHATGSNAASGAASDAVAAVEPQAPPLIASVEPQAVGASEPGREAAAEPGTTAPRARRQSVKKPVGKREYPVQVRRQLRVYTEDDMAARQYHGADSPDDAEVMERSDEMRFDP